MIALWFLAGGAIEALNMVTRKHFVENAHTRGTGAFAAFFIGGLLLRMAATAGVLALAFRHSFASGMMALMGYLVGRWITIMWLHRRRA